jgi:hypothetical protein
MKLMTSAIFTAGLSKNAKVDLSEIKRPVEQRKP